MEIYLSQEVLAGVGAAFAGVIVALFVAVGWMVKHVGSFSMALGQHAEVNAELSGQLKDIIEERRKDRTEWETERDTWSDERQKLNSQVAIMSADYEKRLDNLTLDYTRLQSQLRIEQVAREKGERDHAAKIEQLRNRISELERERNELKTERDELRIERDKLSARVDELYAEVDRLKKHGTGPISAAARDAAREAQDEAAPKSDETGQGEEKPTPPERSA